MTQQLREASQVGGIFLDSKLQILVLFVFCHIRDKLKVFLQNVFFFLDNFQTFKISLFSGRFSGGGTVVNQATDIFEVFRYQLITAAHNEHKMNVRV